MTALVATFGKIPQADLAKALGVTQPTVSNWMRGAVLPSRRNIERLLDLHVSRLIEPIVEFHKISPVRSGGSWRLVADKTKEGRLRNRLRRNVGIYAFYDSGGRVTYLGKTENDLWNEAKQRLKAFVNRPFYNPGRTQGIRQGDVARFISAYGVRVPAAIHNLEVLMLRAFPNDLANTNIGKFKIGL